MATKYFFEKHTNLLLTNIPPSIALKEKIKIHNLANLSEPLQFI
jgi:hypothetical protein